MMRTYGFLFKTALAVTVLAGTVAVQAQEQAAAGQAAAGEIVQGEVWYDTDGNPINAHGGGILYHNGTYYWYGEYKKGPTVLPEWATWECYRTDVTGVSCYSSQDLVNWKFEGIVLPAVKDDKGHDLHPGNVLERPKVIYNRKTGKFVMWMHIDSADYSKACAGVAVSDSPTGKFTYLGSFRPNGAMSRDQTVFVDDDGRAYHIYSSEHNATMYISELTDDYLRPAGRYTRNFIRKSREAPAVFKHDGKYYMLSSGCSGWDPNKAELAVADSIMGEWRTAGNPCTGPDADKTFYSQSTFVQKVMGKKNMYIAMFDRWNKTDLEDSRYVWLPVSFEDGKVTIPWREKWSPDEFEDEGRFEAGSGTFLLDGKPFVVKAAELHYLRIPRPYWEHRIKLCKALGMNTICLYVFWNAHEETPGEFDFTGQKDLAEFCRLCKENGMYVILRPGPYACAEWEMGGLPWWLLKKKDIRLRESDPWFLKRVAKFEKAVAEQVGRMTIADGGPIIMVQVENEYGAYGEDKEYMSRVRDIIRESFGNDVLLFQCDWASNFTKNGLDDLVWTMNFGAGADIDRQFARLKELRPDSPLMCSEYWSGWFDKWGANHETRSAEKMVNGIDEMLSKDISFSLYMTHGGTSWGHWAGANSPGYAPDVTSYDYDAPISESGRITPKYRALREVLEKYSGGAGLPDPPDPIKTVRIPAFEFTEVAPLSANLPAAKRDSCIRTMEEYDQGFGSILYRTVLPEVKDGAVLTVNDPHDYAQVYIDGKYIGKLDRRLEERQLVLPASPAGARLDILVEAMGRINFGRAIKDFKGITENVELSMDLGGYTFVCDLNDWEVFNIEDNYGFYRSMEFQPIKSLTDGAGQRIPGCYRGHFNVRKVGDTFLDFSTWGKGLVYVNGHALGRIWSIGPQQTLYVPGCWLTKGENEILVFDIAGPEEARSEGLEEPVLDQLNLQIQSHGTENEGPDLSGKKPVFTGSLKRENNWQEVKFSRPEQGRYVCIEALDSHDGKDLASIAELYLLDGKGERLSRESWTVEYADSEDISQSNASAVKMYDLQESTSWNTKPGDPYPHTVVIDLGAVHTLTGIRFLPRMESDVPGCIRNFRVYVTR